MSFPNEKTNLGRLQGRSLHIQGDTHAQTSDSDHRSGRRDRAQRGRGGARRRNTDPRDRRQPGTDDQRRRQADRAAEVKAGADFPERRRRYLHDNGSQPPATKEIIVDTDKNGMVNPTGLPTCTVGKIVATNTESAEKACPKAIVGKGVTDVRVAFPESTPFTPKARWSFSTAAARVARPCS